ncbi:response regulator [Segetibacter aerophilus]|uniref:Two-component system response regulator n=1 Tax=Segetibacter aerophilus TaxID=670293 RepID=A0A512BIT3_9BACT|nr:response regulator [Segetibacter aerophilus]GEO11863.1 two-component system response regulator [Segetibacter aerophilus]
MDKNGEIIFIEDDLDDRQLFEEAYRELAIPNPLVVFKNGHMAYQYFNNMKKALFLIISDINMPIMTGIELRDKMQQVGEMKLRTIPFLFLTTGTSPKNILYSYSHSAQGFFQKPNSYLDLKILLQNIHTYWSSCTEATFSNLPPQRETI